MPISEMTPIIYTPVVGAASELYSHIYRRPRGLYISYRHRGEIKTLLSNAPHPDVAIIVVTDGERVLLRYVKLITEAAARSTHEDVQQLREAGWNEDQIAEAVYVTAMFAFFNRVADAFGVPSQNYFTLNQLTP